MTVGPILEKVVIAIDALEGRLSPLSGPLMSTRRPNHAARHIFSVGRVIFTSILKNINASRYIVMKFDSSFVIEYDTAGTRAQWSYPVFPRPARRTSLLIPNGVISVVAPMAFPSRCSGCRSRRRHLFSGRFYWPPWDERTSTGGIENFGSSSSK